MLLRSVSYPRAALIGNPSDGYNGKTIAFTFSNFESEVVLYHSPELEILSNTRDRSRFRSLRHLVDDVNSHGYYGGIRLLKATVKKFYEYRVQSGIELDDRNFTIRYRSNIPHGMGLGGSSAIITACVRALMAFFEVRIIKPLLANLVLSVETDELGIAAGLQDRVAQVYQGLVYMDFASEVMSAKGYGRYEYLDAALLPRLYIAYRTDLAEVSDIIHKKYKTTYEDKSSYFRAAISRLAEMTDEVRDCLQNDRIEALSGLINENFDLRNKLSGIAKGSIEMVAAASSVGASAKFTGSGGAIIGVIENEKMGNRLKRGFESMNAVFIIPVITKRYKD